ncbi:ATP-binding protein [Patulibacter sp. S7RM1-6]
MTAETVTIAGATGTPVSSVPIAIDYAIIRHFSDHLYGSPNKAVEELVTNGYDALATDVRVYVPGEQVADAVVIWDDGESMDVEDLKQLWQIANSPKDDGTERVAKSDRVAERKVIGKFGIGKLASYSVGNSITHLCKSADQFLLVNVDYRALIPDNDDSDSQDDEGAQKPDSPDRDDAVDVGLTDAPSTQEAAVDGRSEDIEVHEAPILRLDSDQARAWVDGLFRDDIDRGSLDEMWSRESWTLAVIGELKDVTLPPGRLGWVLSTGMPLRDDFRIFVNDDRVKPRLAKNVAQEWSLSNESLAASVAASWTEARDNSDVSGDLVHDRDPDDAKQLMDVITLPNLGEVRATVRFFADSLNKGKAAKHGRSYGFFIYVRGRLLNPDDALVLLSDPSFSMFYRTQWLIYADELDDELLADRERLRRDTAKSGELEALQRGLYLAARSEFDRLDQASKQEQSSASLLPVDSREGFREPFTSLLLNSDGIEDAGFDLSSPSIERSARDPGDPLAVLDSKIGGFSVNASHPLIAAIKDRLGDGKVAKEAMRAVDLFAVAERLLEGHLYDTGMTETRIDAVLEWRDDLFRAMASRYRGAPDEIISQVRETSFLGRKPFEEALAELFRLMGFEATRDGAPGQKDVLVIAPIGTDEFKFTVEGKGSANAVKNDEAEISIAASHREKVGARHAIVVAREFTGFAKPDSDPELLKQCRATANVSVVTTDVLEDLYEAVHRYFYPLDMILPALEAVESPEKKKQRVKELKNPVDDFDVRALLDLAWGEQQHDASGDVVPFRGLWQRHYKTAMTFDEFRVKLQALEALSRGLIRLQADRAEGTLRQSPEIIANAIAGSLKQQA